MQQVNLYTAEFQPRKVILPLEQLLLLTFGTIMIVFVVSLVLNQKLADAEHELAAQVEKTEKMRQRVEVLQAKTGQLQRDESLVLANERLRRQLNARKSMIDVLDSVVVKDDDGFSGVLTALARQRTEGLWLKRIKIGAAGKNMALEGMTRSADLVPAYLQNLRQEDDFVGRTFTLFKLSSADKRNQYLNFELRSILADGGPLPLVKTEDALAFDTSGVSAGEAQ